MYLENDRPIANRNMSAAFLAGGLIGVGIAVLLAPSSGAETRARIARSARDLSERFRSTMREIDGGLRNLTENVDMQLSRVERLMRAVQKNPEPVSSSQQAWQRSTAQ
jgi:gas vesicle protein